MKPIALVTGGTRGIGLGVAESLARAGFDLVVCGLRPAEQVEDALTRLRAAGADARYVPCDVGDRAARERLVATLRARPGRLHILVNNAGVAPTERRDVLDATEESFERLMRINLQGPYFLTQSVARWMIEQREADADYRGCIVFVTSVSASVASINRGEYCVSKAGLSMGAALWAARLAPQDIPVYEVRPGIIRTDMTAGVTEKYDRLIGEGLLLQPRWGTPDDVGRAVVALAQGALPYSTGQVLTVDGGLTFQRL